MTKPTRNPERSHNPPPPRRAARWIVAAALTLLAVASLLWTAGEYALERQLQKTVLGLEHAGFRFAIDHRSRGGWPLSATLTLHGLQVDGPSATNAAEDGHPSLPLHWSAERLTLQASPLHPLSTVLIAGGTQHLRLGTAPELTLWGDRIAAYLAWHPGLPLRLPFEARALHAALGQAGPDWVTTIATAGGHLLFSTGGNLAVRLDMDGITLPQAALHPLGRVVDHVSASVALPPGLDTPGWPGTRKLLLQQGTLAWAGMHLDLRGTLGFDPLLGRFSLGVNGLHGALQDAVRDGDLPTGVAASLNGLTGLIEQANGGHDSLRDLPLLLHDGVWSVGAVPLWRMP